MANEVLIGSARQTALLERAGVSLAAGATIQSFLRLTGQQRVFGVFKSDQASAAGYPRVRQSIDGSAFIIIDVIPRDTDQPDFCYPFDIVIKCPYVSVEFQNGGTPATDLDAQVYSTPVFGSGTNQTAPSGGTVTVRSDKDTDFAGPITQNDQATANLTGLSGNTGTITAITLLAEENLDWEVVFWSSDIFGDSNLDLDSYLDSVVLSAVDAMTVANDVSTTYRYAVSGLAIPYFDDDQTNELHVSLIPRNGNKTAGAGGEVVLQVSFSEEVES